MSFTESLGERIKRLRLNAKLTQQELAILIGKSKGNVSGYEKGNFEPSANTIIELAKCFKVSTDFILTGTKIENSINNLTEGERDILELIHPLSPKEQQRVIGVVENYLGKQVNSGDSSSNMPISTENIHKEMQKYSTDNLEVIKKLVRK